MLDPRNVAPYYETPIYTTPVSNTFRAETIEADALVVKYPIDVHSRPYRRMRAQDCENLLCEDTDNYAAIKQISINLHSHAGLLRSIRPEQLYNNPSRADLLI